MRETLTSMVQHQEHLQLADQEAERRADRDQYPLVLLEGGAQQALELRSIAPRRPRARATPGTCSSTPRGLRTYAGTFAARLYARSLHAASRWADLLAGRPVSCPK